MSAQCEMVMKQAAGAPMSGFERYLTIWVFLCIMTGIVCGQLLPGFFHAIGHMEVAQVNLPVGLLIWVMIIPMLVKVDFGLLMRDGAIKIKDVLYCGFINRLRQCIR